jgi:putative ABC transport system permease protein
MPDWQVHLDAALAQEQLDAARLAEVREEIAEHLEDRYHALLAEGMKPAEAEQQVVNELEQGSFRIEPGVLPHSASDYSYDNEPGVRSFCRSVMTDLRYGLRQLRLSPGFALAALLSLALGIGANTAIFELLDAVRLRTLPVKNPEELASVQITYKPHGRSGRFRGQPDLTRGIYEAARSQQEAFTAFAAWSAFPVDLSRNGEARNGSLMLASGNLFDLLGVGTVMGRLISPSDDQKGCAAAPAVVSYGYWQREMGGRTSAVGEHVWVNRHFFVVAGITAPSFFGLQVGDQFDVALPLCAEPIISGDDSVYNMARAWWLGGVGRLKPGWDLTRASAQLAAISPGIMQATMPPEYNSAQRSGFAEMKLGALAGATGYSELRETYDRPFWLLLGISALVLLIACGNLANLMLARATAREREMAVRLAHGASRARLLRQLLSESLLLAVLGAFAGIVLAQVLSRALVPLLGSAGDHIFVQLHIDWRVLGFSAALAVITCILFGLSPALQASSVAPSDAMKAGSRGVVSPRSRFGFRRALITMQIALSLALVVGALLFVRTFRNLSTVDPGFQAERIIVARVDFSSLQIPTSERTLFKRRLTDAVRAIPGVHSAASSRIEPAHGHDWNEDINIPSTGTYKAEAWFNTVSPGYFATLGNSLLAGRDFSDRDGPDAPKVAIISRAFATKLFHDPAPIGKTFGIVQYGDKPDELYQVIGVTQDMKYTELREEFAPLVCLPDSQTPMSEGESHTMLMIRSDEPAEVLIPEIRQRLLKLNPALVLRFSRMKDDVADGLVAERLMAILAGFFAVLAIVLAVVGLYGVIAYMVARRTNEIGIRMALGADRMRILLLIMKEVSLICAVGLLAGFGLTLAAAPAIRSLLYGLRPTDPATLAVAAVGLSAFAALASLIPAWRAAHLDPIAAIHEE